MKDIAIRVPVAGCLGGLIYQTFVWIFNIVGIAKITPFQVGAYMLIKPGSDIITLSAQLLGTVQHFSNSIFLALIVAYIIDLMCSDYFMIKGLAFGGIVYFILYGVIGRFIFPVSLLQPDLTTSTIFMLGNLLYGLTVATVLRAFS